MCFFFFLAHGLTITLRGSSRTLAVPRVCEIVSGKSLKWGSPGQDVAFQGVKESIQMDPVYAITWIANDKPLTG